MDRIARHQIVIVEPIKQMATITFVRFMFQASGFDDV